MTTKQKLLQMLNIADMIEQEQAYQSDITGLHGNCLTCEISGGIAESNDRIRGYIVEYAALSTSAFNDMRELRMDSMKAGKPVPESKGAGLALSSHNSEMYSSQLNPAA